mgnify:CR=1 FL=1
MEEGFINPNNKVYYINTSEIPSERSRENFISSHVKITGCLHTWRDHRRYGYIINRAFERVRPLEGKIHIHAARACNILY